MATKLLQSVPCLYDPEYPFEFTSKSYLDLYPRDKLVYLTPHCRNELTTINIDDIYIIGKFNSHICIHNELFLTLYGMN